MGKVTKDVEIQDRSAEEAAMVQYNKAVEAINTQIHQFMTITFSILAATFFALWAFASNKGMTGVSFYYAGLFGSIGFLCFIIYISKVCWDTISYSFLLTDLLTKHGSYHQTIIEYNKSTPSNLSVIISKLIHCGLFFVGFPSVLIGCILLIIAFFNGISEYKLLPTI